MKYVGGPALLGPAIYYYDRPNRIWKLGDIRVSWLPVPVGIERLRRYRSYLITQQPFQIDYITGCAMLIHRDIFEKVGYFDERYFMYFEDADFCRRVKDLGFEIWCVPGARVWHKISLSARRDRSYSRYQRIFNQVRFYHEHKHGPSVILREVYMFLQVVKILLMDFRHGEWSLVSPSFKGLIAGYREQLGYLI